jgi:hypothetical protein
MAKKAKNKKKSGACAYFLDHPQIKRNPSPGNGNVPGSIASQINFGGKGSSSSTTPSTNTSSSSSSSSSSKPSIAEQINFGGKFK